MDGQKEIQLSTTMLATLGSGNFIVIYPSPFSFLEEIKYIFESLGWYLPGGQPRCCGGSSSGERCQESQESHWILSRGYQ